MCFCPPGYSGDDCSELTGSCSPNPCQNGGSCLPGASPVCSCPPGYAGPLCETDGNTCSTNMHVCASVFPYQVVVKQSSQTLLLIATVVVNSTSIGVLSEVMTTIVRFGLGGR